MAGKGITIMIQGDGEGAAEALRQIEAKMRETGAAGNEMSEQLQVASERVTKALEYAGISFGLHEVVDGIKQMVKSSIDLGMELGHLSKQTGISTENLSVLKYASDQTGVGFESLQKGFKKLSTEMFLYQSGSKEAVKAFGLLNISQRDIASTGGDVWKMLETVSDRMASMPDGWQKNAAATQLFGRAGTELIPVLNQGSAALDEYRSQAEALGIVLDQAGVQKMEELHRESVRVQAGLQGLALELTSVLAPAISNWSQGMEIALGYLREWLNLEDNGKLAAIPQNILNLKDPGATVTEAGQSRTSAEEKIGALEDLHKRKLVSETEFQEKMLALHRQYDQATADESAANATILYRQISSAEQKQEALREKLAKGVVLFAGGNFDAAAQADKATTQAQLAENQKHLDALKAQQAHFLNEMSAAQERVKGDVGPSGAPVPDNSAQLNKIEESNLAIARLMAEEALKDQREIEAVNTAKLRLQVDADRATQAEAKEHGATLLAVLEAQYDSEYDSELNLLAKKHAIEEQTFDAQRAALEKQRTDIEQQRQWEEKGSPRQLELDQQITKVNQELAALAESRAQAEARITTEMNRQKQAGDKAVNDAVRSGKSRSSDTSDAKYLKDQGYDLATSETQTFLSGIENLSGKHPLQRLVDNMIQDLERYTSAIIEHQFIIPMLQQMFGMTSLAGQNPGWLQAVNASTSGLQTQSEDITAMIPGAATGGDIDGLTMVGEQGPELFMPNTPGTVIPNDLLGSLSKGGSGGGAPSVTINNVNNSSQPVTMKQGGVSYDSQARQFIVHTVLEDMQQGGPVSQALRGIGS